MQNEDVKVRAMFKAMILLLEYDGVVPSYDAYGDAVTSIEEEVDERVDTVMGIFNEIYKEMS